jgi:hypothetical protein
MRDEIEGLLRDADEARALPGDLRTELEQLMVTRAWASETATDGMRSVEEALAGVDAPRPLPKHVRARLERAMGIRGMGLAHRAIAVAATVTLLAASGVALLRPNPPGQTPSPAPIAGGTVGPNVGDAAEPMLLPIPTEVAEAGAGVGEPASAPSFPDVGQAGGPAPPYAFSSTWLPVAAATEPTSPGSGAGGVAAGSAPPPIRIAIVPGDAEMEAGFRGYVALLNRAGGIAGRRTGLVTASEGRPAPKGVLATVNLSGRAISEGGIPSWVRGPVLEGLDATEGMLRRSVFGFASPPERQAHLIADAMYPTAVTEPTTAIVYHTSGTLFGEMVPDALGEVLEARGVTVVRIAYATDGRANLFVPGDVAFLSMDTAAAAMWFTQTRQASYEPFRGIAGIYSLMDGSLLPAMDGRRVTVIGPYARPDTPETRSKDFGADPAVHTTGRAHGWVTAKSIAVAVWRQDGSTPAQTRAALAGLTGYPSGFGPAYRVRPGTNARTPEGMLFGVEDGRFVARSGFLRDPR